MACPALSVEEIVEAAVDHGYDGIEWRVADGELLGPQTAESVWRRIGSTELPAICLDTSCSLVRSSDTKRAESVDEIVLMAKRAEAIGAPLIRVFGGRYPDRLSIEDVVGGGREVLERSVDAVGEGVGIAVETHDAWSRGPAIAQLVSGTGASTLWDVAHSVRAGESPSETLRAIGLPALVHLKDAHGDELVPLGAGDIPLANAIRCLRSLGYNRWLSFEWEKLWYPDLAGPEEVLPAARSYLSHPALGVRRTG